VPLGARLAKQVEDLALRARTRRRRWCEVCVQHVRARGRRHAKRQARHPAVPGRGATPQSL